MIGTHRSTTVAALTTSVRGWRFRRSIPLYLMLLPALVGLALFSYYPMLGMIIAFKNYKPLLGFARSEWVGLYYFVLMFSNPDIWEIIRNTLLIAVGKIVFGQGAAVVFALMLNEVRHQLFKRTVQSISYLLHFLSWLIFGAMMLELLSTYGIVNDVLTFVGFQRTYLLGNANTFQPVMIFTDIWKEFGWGAVIYLAALTGIDPPLYEAAAVDGAGRWQRTLLITLPGLLPTIVLMATLNLGGVLNAGFEQILVLYSPLVYSTGDIIDTWLYRTGLLGSQFSLATAVGLVRGLVGFVMISVAYFLADRLANYRIF